MSEPVPSWLAGPSPESVEAATDEAMRRLFTDLELAATPGMELTRIRAECRAEMVAQLTAAWPLLARQIVEGCAVEADREHERQQADLATQAESKDVGVMHYCAGEGADRVAARLRALVPPTGEGVAK